MLPFLGSLRLSYERKKSSFMEKACYTYSGIDIVWVKCHPLPATRFFRGF